MATTITRREIRKRGFFGWVFLLAFLGFNALMAWWMIAAGRLVADGPAQAGEAAQAGHAIGAALGFGMILFVWVSGAVILGLLAMLTRGRKTIVEEVR